LWNKREEENTSYFIDWFNTSNVSYLDTIPKLRGNGPPMKYGPDRLALLPGEIKLGVLTPMNFVQRPKNVRMEAGGQGAMDCEAEGDPKPRIVWRVDAKPLPRYEP
jgi:hypothetical protein